jgi:hypothetical protein
MFTVMQSLSSGYNLVTTFIINTYSWVNTKTTTVLKNKFSLFFILLLWDYIQQVGKWAVGQKSCAWIWGEQVRYDGGTTLDETQNVSSFQLFCTAFSLDLRSLKAYIVGMINLWIQIVRQRNAFWWELFASKYIPGN